MLEESSYYTSQMDMTFADHKIIMSSLTYENDPIPNSNEWMHQIALYTGKITGVYMLDDDEDFVGLNAWLQSIVKQNGIYALNFIGIP